MASARPEKALPDGAEPAATPAPPKAPEPHRLAVIMEEYKLYVDTLEKLIARRLTMNAFFISINTILLGGAVVAAKAKDIISVPLALIGAIAMAGAGVMVAVVWRRLLDTYRVISTAKFDLIHEMEQSLPAQPFTREWQLLQKVKYKSSSATEGTLPILFGVIYLILGISSLVTLVSTTMSGTPAPPVANAASSSTAAGVANPIAVGAATPAIGSAPVSKSSPHAASSGWTTPDAAP